MEKMDDAPDRDHNEDSDKAIEHHYEALVLFLSDVGEIADQAPEKYDDRDGDYDADEAVEKTIDRNERIQETYRRSERRHGEYHERKG